MKYLHSIYLYGESKSEVIKIPERIQLNLDSFKLHHPEHFHKLYSDEETRSFIIRHFDKDVLQTYDDLVPLAYKADLARYCILYVLGGVYSDLSHYFFNSVYLNSTEHEFVVFREYFNSCPWMVNNGLIATPPKNRLFQLMIERIVANCYSNYYGRNSLSPTGPNLFGSIIASEKNLFNINCGQVVAVGKSPGTQNVAFLNNQERLICIKYKEDVGLRSLGGHHNSYNEIWDARKIYKSHQNQPLIFDCAYFWTRKTINISKVIDEGLGLAEFNRGVALYGPYIDLEEGNYSAEFTLQGTDFNPTNITYKIDVTADHGSKLISQSKPTTIELDVREKIINFEFSIKSAVKKSEVRLHIDNNAIFSFKNLKITRLQKAPIPKYETTNNGSSLIKRFFKSDLKF